MKLACISTLLVLGLVYAVYCEEGEKSNIFAVRVLPGTDVHALASKHRMSFKRRAFHDDSIILLEAPQINHEPNFHMNSDITWFERQTLVTRVKKQVLNAEWSDPQYPLQFHLRDDAFDQDINVRGTWGNGDYGAGILISVIDDGVDPLSLDLVESGKFNFDASYDFNNDDTDPTPESGDNHGAACAGIIAASGNNSFCGVGVAPEANVAGIKLISAGFNAVEEADALTYRLDIVDIYSNSWGPPDDGNISNYQSMTEDALINGVTNGRGGKGAIYVWAAGNGREENDNSNYDGYANSRYTIAVGAIQIETGEPAFYSEPGCNLFVVAPSSDDTDAITTSAVGNECINDFGGTSAST